MAVSPRYFAAVLPPPDLGTGSRYLLRPRGLEIDQEPSLILASNPRRVAAYIFNAGGKLELPIDLGAGVRLGAALPAQTFIDSGAVAVPPYALSSYKTFVLLVDTTLTWVGAVQVTAQLLVGRNPWSPAAGATSQAGIPGTGNAAVQNSVKGAVTNLGAAAATTLPAGLYFISPADIADLQWPYAYIGLELKFGGALTAGAARLFLTQPGGPALLLGHDKSISANTGERANSFMLPPLSAPLFLPTDRELYGMATPGGTTDVRIWEILNPEPKPASVDGRPPAASPAGG